MTEGEKGELKSEKDVTTSVTEPTEISKEEPIDSGAAPTENPDTQEESASVADKVVNETTDEPSQEATTTTTPDLVAEPCVGIEPAKSADGEGQADVHPGEPTESPPTEEATDASPKNTGDDASVQTSNADTTNPKTPHDPTIPTPKVTKDDETVPNQEDIDVPNPVESSS